MEIIYIQVKRCFQGPKATRTVHLVDVPGHPRVRRGFQAHLPSARGVIFVLDSVDFLPHKTETAECAQTYGHQPCHHVCVQARV